jgi:hypothetical protein
VEEYTTNPEREGNLPTRVLISLGIKNKCNITSREKLGDIISQEFPQLEDYTDLLYGLPGKRFTQGSPLSPVFTGTVLYHITRKIHTHLLKEVNTCIRKTLKNG